jgi:WYL domain
MLPRSFCRKLIQTPFTGGFLRLRTVPAILHFHAKSFTFGRSQGNAYNAAGDVRSMKSEPGQVPILPPLYVIFTLLSALRRGVERKNLWREFRRQGIPLQPRLSFWVALCREAGLLDGDQKLTATRQARQWLNKTSDEQAFHLLDAWQNAPKNMKVRQFRRKIVWKLKYGLSLTSKDRGALHGLQALGMVHGDQLTCWGKFFIKGEGKLPTPLPPQPCYIRDQHFVASPPDHIEILWDLEAYLRPAGPGRYPLTRRALSLYSGNPEQLITLLEQGLGESVPGQTKAMILRQPSIRISDGLVLEFSSPAELQELRRQPVLRKYVDDFLSPQRVLVSREKAGLLLQMLKRRGVHTDDQLPATSPGKKRTHFSQKTILLPVGRTIPKLDLLQKYLSLQQAVDILYRAPGYPAEQRRITPLSIEQRGEHTYVVAFCQNRRAQRLFRLDRMEIPGTY